MSQHHKKKLLKNISKTNSNVNTESSNDTTIISKYQKKLFSVQQKLRKEFIAGSSEKAKTKPMSAQELTRNYINPSEQREFLSILFSKTQKASKDNPVILSLQDAVMDGDLGAVMALSPCCDLNDPSLVFSMIEMNSENRSDPQMMACNIVLIENIDTSESNPFREELLHWAIRKGNIAAIEVLVMKGIDPNAKSPKLKMTPLQYAASRRNYEAVITLVMLGARIEGKILSQKDFERLNGKRKKEMINVIWALLASGATPSQICANPIRTMRQNELKEAIPILKAFGAKEEDEKENENINKEVGEVENLKIKTLHKAAMIGDIEAMDKLLSINSDVDSKVSNGMTALHVACRFNMLTSIERLIRAKANLEAKDQKGYTALNYTAIYGTREAVSLLMNAKADVQSVPSNYHCKTSYGIAAIHGNIETMNGFIKSSVRPTTDFEAIARYGSPKAVKYIISLFVNLNVEFSNGRNLLHCAAQSIGSSNLKIFLKAGLPVDKQDGNGETPLHLSVLSMNPDNVKALIESGADINIKNGNGDTPLHLAVSVFNKEIIKILLDVGADPRIKNAKSKAAVDLSTNREILKALQERADLFNKYDEYKEADCVMDPFLIKAVQRNDFVSTKYLLSIGVNPNITVNEQNKFTLLHLTSKGQNELILKSLIKAGADPNAVDEYGQTPLHIAAKSGSLLLTKALIKAGANPMIIDNDSHTAFECSANSRISSYLSSFPTDSEDENEEEEEETVEADSDKSNEEGLISRDIIEIDIVGEYKGETKDNISDERNEKKNGVNIEIKDKNNDEEESKILLAPYGFDEDNVHIENHDLHKEEDGKHSSFASHRVNPENEIAEEESEHSKDSNGDEDEKDSSFSGNEIKIEIEEDSTEDGSEYSKNFNEEEEEEDNEREYKEEQKNYENSIGDIYGFEEGSEISFAGFDMDFGNHGNPESKEEDESQSSKIETTIQKKPIVSAWFSQPIRESNYNSGEEQNDDYE